MMKILVVILVLMLAACSNERTQELSATTDCSNYKAEIAKFIVDCAKAANPLSDEEGEDLVEQCEVTGKHVLCDIKTQVVFCKNTYDCIDDKNQPVIRGFDG
jgi:hypothetical protein